MLRILFLLTLFIFINKNGLCHDHSHSEKPFDEDDSEHLNEHLKEFTNKRAEDLSKEEKRFYEFRLHDLNNDYVLDGLEIFWLIGSSKIHGHNNMTLNEIAELTDHALHMYDMDENGYVTYAEIHA